jgi:hypothetical protein
VILSTQHKTSAGARGEKMSSKFGQNLALNFETKEKNSYQALD